MVDRIDPERQWAFLLQKLRSFPLDWRGTDEHARRLDALGKEAGQSSTGRAMLGLTGNL